MLGVGQNQIRGLLAREKINGINLGHDWIVYVTSLEKYLQTKSPKGLPPSKAPKLQEAN